jgi:hypothetical protein
MGYGTEWFGEVPHRTTKGDYPMAREVKAKKFYIKDVSALEAGNEDQRKQSYFEGARLLVFAFANGEQVVVDPAKFNDFTRTAAMYHGLSQKLGDAYASSKDADEAWEKFESLREQLEAGNWLAERESAGPRISLVVKAIVAAKAKAGVTVTEEEVAAKYNEMDKERQKTVLQDPRINAEYQRIRAEQAAERAAKAAEAANAAAEAGTEIAF